MPFQRFDTPYSRQLSNLHLLNAPRMKDVTRIPAAVGPSSLARTQSLREPAGYFRSTLISHRNNNSKTAEDTIVSPKVEKSEGEASVQPKPAAPTFAALKVKSEFPSPLPIAVQLARSATMREASTSTSTSTSAVPVPVPPREDIQGNKVITRSTVLNGLKQRYLQRSASLRSQYNLVSRTTLNTNIEQVERQIQLKVKNLPSFTIQQSGGANFTPEWSWLTALRPILAGKESSPYECLSEMNELHTNMRKASSMIAQIRLDFDYGLMSREYEEPSGEVMAKMDLFQSGDREKKIMLKCFQPFIPEIMANEQKKQEKYGKWLKNLLRCPADRKRRGEIVEWVCQATLELNYSGETTHLAMFLVDAWLSGRVNEMTKKTWMLLACAAVLVAGKLEEPDACKLSSLITLSNRACPRDDIVYMEARLLEYMRFQLFPPLAPILVQLEIMGGSISFPCPTSKKLIWDLALGILMKSLSSYTLVSVLPSEKAQAALEIATEFVLFKYKRFSRLDLEKYDCATNEPGKAIGNVFVQMCYEMFQQRFVPKVFLPMASMTGRTGIPAACAASPSPVKGVRG